ncbi:MAG: hypothetical protein JRG73_18305 [Deltaproteobacteria bacterium]|nr:hypothetical protein [Deltaproteobacteria bacterium]
MKISFRTGTVDPVQAYIRDYTPPVSPAVSFPAALAERPAPLIRLSLDF